MSEKHMQLPLEYTGNIVDELGFPCITDRDGMVVCSVVDDGLSEDAAENDDIEGILDERAALIVKAVNSYASLIEERKEMVKALKRLYRGYVNSLENGRDRIMSLGGDCDPVDVMEAGNPDLIEARALLSRIGEERT